MEITLTRSNALRKDDRLVIFKLRAAAVARRLASGGVDPGSGERHLDLGYRAARPAQTPDLRPEGGSASGLDGGWAENHLCVASRGQFQPLQPGRRRPRHRRTSDHRPVRASCGVQGAGWNGNPRLGTTAGDGRRRRLVSTEASRARRPAGRLACGEGRAADSHHGDRVQPGSVTGRPLSRLPVERVRAVRDLRAAVPPGGQGPVARVDRRRHETAVGAKRTRALLSRSGEHTDGGIGADVRRDAGVRYPARVLDKAYAQPLDNSRPCDVHPDGQRFLMVKDNPTGDRTATTTSMVVVLNFFEELKAKLDRP